MYYFKKIELFFIVVYNILYKSFLQNLIFLTTLELNMISSFWPLTSKKKFFPLKININENKCVNEYG